MVWLKLLRIFACCLVGGRKYSFCSLRSFICLCSICFSLSSGISASTADPVACASMSDENASERAAFVPSDEAGEDSTSFPSINPHIIFASSGMFFWLSIIFMKDLAFTCLIDASHPLAIFVANSAKHNFTFSLSVVVSATTRIHLLAEAACVPLLVDRVDSTYSP